MVSSSDLHIPDEPYAARAGCLEGRRNKARQRTRVSEERKTNCSKHSDQGHSRYDLGELLHNPDHKGISLAEIFDLLPAGVQIVNARRQTIYLNSSFTELFGYALNDIRNRDGWSPYPFVLECMDRDAALIPDADNTLQQVPSVERQIACKDGETKIVDVSLRHIGEYYIYLNTDVSAKSRLISEISGLAYTDSLTGLGNRRAFLRSGEGMLSKQANPVAGLMIDVDHFKGINDRFGHKVGDDALVSVARRCASVVGGRGYLARIGGEEFGLLLPHHDQAAAIVVAEQMREAVASRPHFVAGLDMELPISICLGGAVARSCETSVDLLMAQADHALYDAKRSGRNQVCFADEHHATQL